MTTTEQIRQQLQAVLHPELQRDIVTLNMVREIDVNDDRVQVVLAVPFKETPVRDELEQGIQEAIAALNGDYDVCVYFAEMGQQERAAFLAQAEGEPPRAQTVNKVAHVIAVLSGKGGVGKSSVAALLAVALQRRGSRVGILDADITGPSQPKMFGLHENPKMSPLGIQPVEKKTSIKIMSINLMLPSEDQAVVWRGPMISKAIKQFWHDVVWGELDYLVVDLPPGTSDASLTVMQAIPLSGVVLVTSPQDLAGMVVRKAAAMVQQLGPPILGVVENMSYITCPECGKKIEVFGPSQGRETAERLEVPMLGQIPLDPQLALHCDHGHIEAYSAKDFAPIADIIAERGPALKIIN
jgi:Mrp family chromosome partitioning ATPase